MRVLNSTILTAFAICSMCVSAQAKVNANVPAPHTSEINQLAVSINTYGLAKKTHNDFIKKYPNHSDEPPFMNGEPQHIRVTFDDDKLSDYTEYLGRQLLIYPVQEYSQLFQGKEKIAFDQDLSLLKKIIAAKSDKGAKQIPILPAADAYEVFHNQLKFLNFKQGAGVGFVTCYFQDDAPIKNGDFFYTFQGLTKDGKYYVSFFYPVEVKTLPVMKSASKGAEYLGKLARTQFTPSLSALDHMVESISIMNENDDVTITPGVGIGIVKLGMNRDQITKTLGNRDGKYSLANGIKVEYSQWKDPKRDTTIRVFFDPSGKVVQLNCDAPLPATADGISTQSDLADVTSKYKDLQCFKYRAKDGRIDYYDSIKRGIAFEFTWADTDGESKKRLYAILLHTPGRRVIADSDEHSVR